MARALIIACFQAAMMYITVLAWGEQNITAKQVIASCVQKGDVPCAVGVDNRTINIDKRAYSVDGKLLREILALAKELNAEEQKRFEGLLGATFRIWEKLDRLETQNNEILALLKEKRESGQVTEEKGKSVVLLTPEEMAKLVRLDEGVETAYEDWLKIQKNVNSEQLLNLLVDNATALAEAGEYYKALERARQAYRMDPTSFNALNRLGRSLWDTGQYREAEIKLRDAAAAAKNKEYKATALGNLAVVLQAQGKYAEAEKLYRESLEIDKKAYSEGHPSIATTLGNLAGVLKDQGKYAEAEKLFRESLEIKKKAYSEGHPSIAIDLGNLAGVLQAQGKYAEAERLGQEALDMFKQALGNEHPTTKSMESYLDQIKK